MTTQIQAGNTIHYSKKLTRLALEQHFEFGDENIEFDMTGEINDILNGVLTNVSG